MYFLFLLKVGGSFMFLFHQFLYLKIRFVSWVDFKLLPVGGTPTGAACRGRWDTAHDEMDYATIFEMHLVSSPIQ
jgi:hypothetical protein